VERAYLAAVVYGSLAILISRHLAPWYKKFGLYLGALAAVILVGVSRLVLRMHWLTDILGAYALAAAWLIFNFLVYKKLRRKWRI
jgi:undecaprenyl-diphosphatase